MLLNILDIFIFSNVYVEYEVKPVIPVFMSPCYSTRDWLHQDFSPPCIVIRKTLLNILISKQREKEIKYSNEVLIIRIHLPILCSI